MLITHIDGLPPESAFVRSRRGDAAYWSQDSELLASIHDAIHELAHVVLKIVGASPDEPFRWERPQSLLEPAAIDEGVGLPELNLFLEGFNHG